MKTISEKIKIIKRGLIPYHSITHNHSTIFILFTGEYVNQFSIIEFLQFLIGNKIGPYLIQYAPAPDNSTAILTIGYNPISLPLSK